MPFPFSYLCDLLDELEQPFLREAGCLPAPLREYLRTHTSKWFILHRTRLDAVSTNTRAVLSMLRPHQQTDRAYGIAPEDLELVVARALQLSRLQYSDLQKWRTDLLKRDLAFFVQQVMEDSKEVSFIAGSSQVMAEDIDQTLLRIASYNSESSCEVRSLAETWPDANHVSLLGKLYQKLQPREAKWLTRIVMKNLHALKIPDEFELSASSGHSNLPQCLQVSVKLLANPSAPIRQEGTMVVNGTAAQCSLAPTRSISQASIPARTSGNVFPPTPLTSSPALPMSETLNETTISLPSAIIGLLPTPPTPSHQVPASKVPRKSISWNPSVVSGITFPLTVPTTPYIPPITIASGRSNKSATHAIPMKLPSSTPHMPMPNKTTSDRKEITLSLLPIPNVKASNPQLSTANSRHSPRSTLGELSSNPISRIQKTVPIITGSGKCQLTAKTCPLKHFIFILSPCIASSAYITDSLLSWHGSHYVMSISALSHPSLPRRCPDTGKPYRKIVLVESKHTKPTARFLKEIERLSLQRGGERDPMKVYDWRLLESIGKIDQGQTLSHDPWIRLYIDRI